MPERYWIKLAWLLPRPLVYWATIRLFAKILGETEEPHEVSLDTALKRWKGPPKATWKDI